MSETGGSDSMYALTTATQIWMCQRLLPPAAAPFAFLRWGPSNEGNPVDPKPVWGTARSREDETRNGHWNTKRNPRWSSQVSFHTAHLKTDLNFHNRGFRLYSNDYVESHLPGNGLYRDLARLLGESCGQKNSGATRGKNYTKIEK